MCGDWVVMRETRTGEQEIVASGLTGQEARGLAEHFNAGPDGPVVGSTWASYEALPRAHAEAERTDPLTLRPIDAGFDLRLTDMPPVKLPPGTCTVEYLDADDQPATVTGDPETVAKALGLAGYAVVAEILPSGREIRVERGKHVFVVQPPNDSYWITCETLTEARAAGCGRIDLDTPLPGEGGES